uniref:Protein anoxia up-regulated n=1 Tax=Nyssomyia neivai TaxID=330878 RepID=A0A1L8DDG2_9DIPT
MVYESDFYTTRRPYSSRPNVSSYTVTTPRYYTVTDEPSRPRRAEEQYSYSYSSTSNTSSSDPYSRPTSQSYSARTEKSSRSGPGGYNYSTERTSTAGTGPGGYSYSSTSSGRLPHGTTYRHYSYRV